MFHRNCFTTRNSSFYHSHCKIRIRTVFLPRLEESHFLPHLLRPRLEESIDHPEQL